MSYLTAVDYYVIACFGFVLFSLVESSILHRANYNKSKTKGPTSLNKQIASNNLNYNSHNSNNNKNKTKAQLNTINIHSKTKQKFRSKYNKYLNKHIRSRTKKNKLNIINNALRRNYSNSLVAIRLSSLYKTSSSISSLVFYSQESQEIQMNNNETECSSIAGLDLIFQIDYYAKTFYPISFILFNIIYFTFYLKQRQYN